MSIERIAITFPRLGIVRFSLSPRSWDYLDMCRQDAARMLRFIRNGTYGDIPTIHGKEIEIARLTCLALREES